MAARGQKSRKKAKNTTRKNPPKKNKKVNDLTENQLRLESLKNERIYKICDALALMTPWFVVAVVGCCLAYGLCIAAAAFAGKETNSNIYVRLVADTPWVNIAVIVFGAGAAIYCRLQFSIGAKYSKSSVGSDGAAKTTLEVSSSALSSTKVDRIPGLNNEPQLAAEG